MDTSFLSLPMGAGPLSRDSGMTDELGNTVYRDAFGNPYTIREQAPNRGSYVRAGLHALDKARKAPLESLTAGAQAIAQGAWDAVAAPGRSWSDSTTYGDVANTAGLVSLPAVAGKYDPARVGIFGGVGAKTADKAALSKAQDMAAKGVSRDDIWTETGWFAGPDGKWRFEIDDSGAGFNRDLRGFARSGDVAKSVNHPDLMAAYPFDDMSAYPYEGTFRAGAGTFNAPTYWDMDGPHFKAGDVRDPGRIDVRGATPDELDSTLLHEMQHYVQNEEGFAYGSNLSNEAARIAVDRDNVLRSKAFEGASVDDLAAIRRHDELRDQWQGQADIPADVRSEVEAILARPGVQNVLTKLDDLRSFRAKGKGGALEGGAVSRDDAFRQYQNVAGEAEARNVQARRHMTAAERRATPPWNTLDVPEEDLIVRYGNGPAASIRAYHGSPHDFDRKRR